MKKSDSDPDPDPDSDLDFDWDSKAVVIDTGGGMPIARVSYQFTGKRTEAPDLLRKRRYRLASP